MNVLAALLALSPQAPRVQVEFDAARPAPWTHEYVAPHTGELHAWVVSDAFDPTLALDGVELSKLGRGGEIPGSTTDYFVLELAAGARVRFVVTSETAATAGVATLMLAQSHDDETTQAAAARSRELRAEAGELHERGDVEGASARIADALDSLVSHRSARGSGELMRESHECGSRAFEMGALDVALAAYRLSSDAAASLLPEESLTPAAARANVAMVLAELGELEQAREIETALVALLSRALPGSKRLADARQNLAATLTDLGELDAARREFELAIAVLERLDPRDDVDLAITHGNLGVVLRQLGELARARDVQQAAALVLERALPEGDRFLLVAQRQLCMTTFDLGDVAAARALGERVLASAERTLPDDHPELQRVRSTVALALNQVGEHEAARALFERVLATWEAALPEDDPEVLRARSNLSACLRDSGDAALAVELDARALAVLEKARPAGHPELVIARRNLATSYAVAGRLSDARELQQRVVAELEAQLADDHPELAQARLDLLQTLAEQRVERAELDPTVRAFIRGLRRATEAAVLTSSPREAEERCARMSRELGYALSFAAGLGVYEPDAGWLSEAFALAESMRGAALTSAALARRGARDGPYAELRERARIASEALARLARKQAPPAELDAARGERERCERELARRARELGSRPTLAADPAAITAQLGAGEALVTFLVHPRFELAGEGGADGAHHLSAFVLRADRVLAHFDLGPSERIAGVVARFRATLGSAPGRGVASDESSSGDAERELEAVSALVLAPLARALDGAERVRFVPDDALHLVPFDALALSQDAGAPLAGDRWIVAVSPAIDEAAYEMPAAGRASTLVALGAPDYDAGAAEDARRSFAPLPHTRTEAEALVALHRAVFASDVEPRLLLAAEATRARLFESSRDARWLHIATHGWLEVRANADARRARELSPMLACGIALAGANRAPDADGLVAGLLTAEELSTFDLTACELAVLSACDTNVGEVRAGQGVASLQRALHMAGAHCVITSLWKVPDEATKVLMLDFYRRLWIEKQPARRALWDAKRTLRDARDERGRPLYALRDWAAWVLTGASE